MPTQPIPAKPATAAVGAEPEHQNTGVAPTIVQDYALEPAGALLLNIAQANRLNNPPNCAAALHHYELFPAAEPRAPERSEVEGHMRSMRTCMAASTHHHGCTGVVALVSRRAGHGASVRKNTILVVEWAERWNDVARHVLTTWPGNVH